MIRNIFQKLGVRDRASFWTLFWQIVKFGIVGLSNTAISLVVYYLFIAVNPNFYLWGNTVGWLVSVFNAFFWSNRYVFRQESNTPKELMTRLGKSYLSYGATYLLSQVLLYLEINSWGVSAWLAPLLNLLLTIPLNFLINKFWTFKK